SLLTIGFGPASLAIAIALADHLSSSPSSPTPPVLFLEKQAKFNWHAGMQLAGTHMQISFLKDLATPRDPTSPFSFLNYLFTKGRLQKFINLGTFLPARREYEDYMRWCASHFHRSVRYGSEITRVDAVHNEATGKVDRFNVHWVDTATGTPGSAVAKNVVVATGGAPAVPEIFAPFVGGEGARFIHSSQYATSIPGLSSTLLSPSAPQHLVVIGGGQSAAEIYVDLSVRFPSSRITLLVKDASLRPSDDSPFVNEIFDPDRVTPTYQLNAADRAAKREKDKGTNYGVVRLELLERIYSELYAQEVDEPEEANWRCRVRNSRTVVGVEKIENGVKLEVAKTGAENGERETLEAGLVVFATGYRRDAHVRILEGTRGLLASETEPVKSEAETITEAALTSPTSAPPLAGESTAEPSTTSTVAETAPAAAAAETITEAALVPSAPTTTPATTTETTTETTASSATESEVKITTEITSAPAVFPVGRDYKVQYAPGAVEEGSGIWLQGCNEKTHGLSDTLLSILAHRGGEVVQSIFGPGSSSK
ncbi:hypothetical protein V490_09219, partial [Pseudogymnoascus sp. VKM F-3557]